VPPVESGRGHPKGRGSCRGRSRSGAGSSTFRTRHLSSSRFSAIVPLPFHRSRIAFIVATSSHLRLGMQGCRSRVSESDRTTLECEVATWLAERSPLEERSTGSARPRTRTRQIRSDRALGEAVRVAGAAFEVYALYAPEGIRGRVSARSQRDCDGKDRVAPSLPSAHNTCDCCSVSRHNGEIHILLSFQMIGEGVLPLRKRGNSATIRDWSCRFHASALLRTPLVGNSLTLSIEVPNVVE
jgi:hypothetical protein